MTAFGLINFGDDIFPAFVKWVDFIKYGLDFVAKIRDIVLIPLTFPIDKLFGLELLDWYKSYLFIGLLFLNTFNFSYKKICGHFSSSSMITLCFGEQKWRVALMILLRIFVWPIFILELIRHYMHGHHKRKHNVYTLWGKYLFWVDITTLLIIFLNWIWIRIMLSFE
ncbi:hypothetical protein SAMN04487990_1122 [Bizionia paragorgiae]|uniref:Uncharacterized protein n=2 Tax=Bizionia paragorgiae TaxID=283786 RepID=A0A1H4AST6_BIZPA|nr:hypothetical protein SAMN04487990_1122 [Bizionia paragorgiae]